MGQETSVPVSRAANGLSSRRISRRLRGRVASGDDDGRPHPQEELETPTPNPNGCLSPGDPHMGDDPHLIQGHSLVRAHDSQPEQAPPSTETSQTTGSNRPATPDRVGGSPVEEFTKATPGAKGETGQGTGVTREVESTETTMAQVPTSSACPSTSPAASNRDSTQSLEQHRERLLDTSPSSSFGTNPSTAPIAPVAQMESLQSALANANATSHSDSATPSLSSSALPSVSQPPSPSVPRPISLGTTMIVQGLVQTIEVTRIPARNTTSPATTNDESPVVEETAPLLSKDKGKRKEEVETNDEDISGPLASASSPPGTSTSISNASASNTPDSLLSNNTLATSSSTTATNNTTDSSNNTPNTPSELSPTATPPHTSSRPSPSPSSTDVLGLLLSIAAQATAEALVPWSVPPRSRTTSREGIAGGLAAAFNALTSTAPGPGVGSGPQTTTTVLPQPTPTPHVQPIVRLPTPVPAPVEIAPEPRSSSRRFSRRFSGLSLSPGRIPSFSSRRISSYIPGRRADTQSNRTGAAESGRRVSSPISRRAPSPTSRRASTPASNPPRRGVLGRIERWVPRRLRRESEAGPSRGRNESSGPTSPRTGSPGHANPASDSSRPARSSPLDESVDFGRVPPPSTLSVPTPTFPEPSVSPLPSPPILIPAPEPPTISVPTPPISMPVSSTSPVSLHPTSPVSTLPTSPTSTHPSSPIPSIPNLPTPTTDAEDLIRFSQMLGFTPGAVHPPGTFERFLSDMQDELRITLGEYQGRGRGRGRGGAEGNATAGAGATAVDAEGTAATREGTDDPSRMASLLDHTRPHVPSTDPLPLNWWRMYRFPALPEGTASGTESASAGDVTTSQPEARTSPAEPTVASPTPNDAEPQQPIHPAIIIGLRSLARDPSEETADAERRPGEAGDRASRDRVRSSESASRARYSETGDRIRSFESGDRIRSQGSEQRVRRRLRLGEEERRSRDGTRNYMIWIIGGYYPSNHPILVHPNLFLGQVHPDELWMLNEFLGQVKTPTASKEDIAKAGLRVVKGAEVNELAKAGNVTESCTERCLICLDDYDNDEDLRIMNCKHMFHKDCVDHWMETGRNNCPACRTKGVDTASPEPSPSTVS
ncbi:unnamed protein product [Rhizoctonia solani]|uniref:RING-type domain-containing protein n=1 Tax=Rhizoctonia solani TaxID=456999 RepID=A0A8H3ARS8_9AGAM|nr:unnamed protein product [Rhizoctonia solani]